MAQFITVLLVILLSSCAYSQTVAVPNASFEKGIQAPEGWVAAGSGGQTDWEAQGHTGHHAISVNGGKPEDALYWKSQATQLQPGQVYRFSFWSKAQNAGGGCIISGPSGANCDFPFSSDWKRYSYTFMAPERTDGYLRLGHWNATGKTFFDDVSLTPLTPLHYRQGGLELGDGERIAQGTYNFNAPLGTSNYARSLVSATAAFNSNRWVMNGDSVVVYRHRLGTYKQQSASVQLNVNYYVAGKLIVEASQDGNNWLPVAETSKQGSVEATLPAALFPAREVLIRLRAASAVAPGKQDSSPGSFQVDHYTYTAAVDAHIPAVEGHTVFLEEKQASRALPVTVETLGDLRPGGQNVVRLTVNNLSSRAVPIRASFKISTGNQHDVTASNNLILTPGKNHLQIPYRLLQAGNLRANLNVTSGKLIYAAQTEFHVPAMFAADYGYALPKMQDVWWAEGAYKISQQRPVPVTQGDAVEIHAARNEYEPFQIVIRPKHDIKQVMLSCDGLSGPGGARIGKEHVFLCTVGYVEVTQPTDNTGVAGLWPDPLPPLTRPIDLQANRNQPFWVTVYVPEGAKSGEYRGVVKLTGQGWQREVPVHLEVRSFALPRETHVQSAFGFSPDTVRRYHNLETPQELSSVVARYYRNFAQHRISPYSPVFNAPIKVDFGGARWQGGQYDTVQPSAGQRSLRVTDDNPQAATTAVYQPKIRVQPGQPYHLKFAVRTEKPGQTYQVTIGAYDATGAWMSGHNLDITRQGSGAWEQVDVNVTSHLTPPMHSVAVNLRPIPWAEDGSGTGTAWFDEISLTGPDGKNLVEDGGFENEVQPAQVKIDFSRFDPAMGQALAQYHFTSWMVPLEGMGGGTFQARYPGHIGAYAEGTPEYESLFGSYLRQMQDHLEQKGWLDKAYIYWFDEPDTKDYPFVRAGMARIKKYAPKLTRMLTEEPGDALAGAVDLWCPITNNYDPQKAQQRQQAGDRVWWYICTGPKAPYATLFIDHPAVELRTWLWQTWKYHVQGILVWESTYWTSPAAYPNSLQNPWHDPMSWVSGYSTATGTKSPWGNGDGRFLYPPNREVGVDKSKHLEGPVNSIRFEMLREGIEDYEYFYLLRDKVQQAKRKGIKVAAVTEAEQLLQVPTAITSNMTTFATQPQPIMAHREKLAHAIETLSILLNASSATHLR